MEKKTDALLRKLIKSWASRYNPPDNGRARLLWEASRPSHKRIDLRALISRPQVKPYPSFYSNDRVQTLFNWINENTFQYSLQARLS